MKVIDTRLPGVKLIEPRVFGDARGFFYEQWHAPRFAEHGMVMDAVQGNVSRSVRGVLRGLHYQWPQPQAKLVSVLEGEVYDVAVDIRRGSPTFGESLGVVLSAENQRQLWIPEGFAHGFVATSETCLFHYLCSAVYDPVADANIRWNEARFAIDWPVSEPSLSDKDARAPFLAEIPEDRLPVYHGADHP